MLKKILLFSTSLFIFALCRPQVTIGKNNIYPPGNLIIPLHSEWARKHYRERVAEFKSNPLQENDIVFLGNSITEYGGDWAQRFHLTNVKNRGISGDVTAGVIQRLGEICYFKPSHVFLLIGINDLMNPGVSAANTAINIITITEIIHKKTPGTKIFVQTVLPTSNPLLVNKINQLNRVLQEKAGGIYTVLDIHSQFADEHDLIKKDFTTDGIHLSEPGYAIWVNYLKKYFNLK